jgi:hypothetical protein
MVHSSTSQLDTGQHSVSESTDATGTHRALLNSRSACACHRGFQSFQAFAKGLVFVF